MKLRVVRPLALLACALAASVVVSSASAGGAAAPPRMRPQAFVGGTHGYDNAEAAMGGILIAAGPAFRRGAVVAALGSVHVYDLLCRAAGLRPARNDGSPDSVGGFFGGR